MSSLNDTPKQNRGTTDIVALADHHEQAFGAFIRMDSLEHPRPVAPRWWQGLPWLMLPFSLVAMAGIALSSLRTGPVFQAAARPVVGEQFAVIEAILAVVITELFLVVTRYVMILVKARNGEAIHSIDGLMLTGFWLAFGVALFANLYANVGNLPLLAPIKPMVDLIVGILVAVSAPVLAFICGDILAVLWLQSERHRTEMRRQFRLLMEEYQAARERRWNAQKSRYGVRVEIEREPIVSNLSVQPVQLSSGQVGHGQGYTRESKAVQLVRGHLDKYPEDASMRVRDLAEKIGVGKSTVATVLRDYKSKP